MKLYAGLAILGGMAALALLAPGLIGHDPFLPDLFNRYAAPSATHWLGTDDLGRDVLLRLLHGARVSLAVGLGAALMAMLLGSLAGVLAAWAGGVTDAVIMRLADDWAAAGRGGGRYSAHCHHLGGFWLGGGGQAGALGRAVGAGYGFLPGGAGLGGVGIQAVMAACAAAAGDALGGGDGAGGGRRHFG